MPTLAETWIQEGIRQGLRQAREEARQIGRQEGAATFILQQLRMRLGEIDIRTEERIRALEFAQLEQLAEALLKFAAVEDLAGWLAVHSTRKISDGSDLISPFEGHCDKDRHLKSSYDNLLFDSTGAIAVVTLNRPERRNALSLALMEELIDCLGSIGRSAELRAVILAANGPAFCAGHDLSEMQDRSIGDYRRIFDICTTLMTTIQSIPQPVIAEVQGIATAAGCQLVATCDMAVSCDAAQFATPGVRIGLFCTTPMVALTRAIGRKRALEMLMTGTPIDAPTAAEWGLVNRVVETAKLREATLALAERVAAASPLTVGIGKQAFYAQIDLDQAKAYAYAKEVMSLNAVADDAQEGIGAFLQKRPRAASKAAFSRRASSAAQSRHAAPPYASLRARKRA